MDRLEELYFLAFNCNCFKQAHKRGIYDLLGDLENDNVNATLLSLTVVQKLYQRLETVSCSYLKLITDSLVAKNLLVDSLVKYLDHRNQLVVFSATKALVQVLQTFPKQMIKEEWFQALFTFGQETEQPWRKIYIIELVNKILTNTKEPLKNISENSRQQNGNKKCPCTHEADTCSMISTAISRTELAELFLGSFNFQHNLFYYFPFIVRPNGMYCFMRSCQHSGHAEDYVVLQACLKLADAIHNQENVKRKDIAKTDESNQVAFLHCIATVAKYLQFDRTFQNTSIVNVKSHCQNENYLFMFQESDSIDHDGENIPELCERKTDSICAKKAAVTHIKDASANQLCTVMATLIQYLHYPRLPPQIFKKILEVVNEIVVIPLPSQKSKGQKLEKIVISSSMSFLSVVECCLFHKMPQCLSGFVGFSGTKIKGSLESASNKKSSTDLVAMRKASLLVFKSSFVVLKLAAKQEGSLLFQKLSLSCVSLWCSGILSLIPNSLFDNKSTQECSSESEFHDCLVALFVDQDDDLVEVMLLLLLLYQEILDRTVSNCSEVSVAILRQLNPHLLFIAFVESIDFDHSLLLDLLISSETRFLEYLVQYLHFVVDGWDSFVQCLAEYKRRNCCSEKQATSDELSTCSSLLRGFESDSNFVEKPPEFENRLSNELRSRKSDLFSQEQENFIVEEEVCLETPKDVSRATMFQTIPEVCQPDFHPQGNLSGKLNGLTSIVLAYCSSEGSDIEIEAENESANDHETPADTQSDCMTSGTICLKNNLGSSPLDKAQSPAKFHSSFTTKSYSACAAYVSGMRREHAENSSNPLFEERCTFFSKQPTGTLCLNNDGYLESEQSSSSSTKVLPSSDKDTKARITKGNHKESFGDHTVPQYKILDKTMTMLIRLRLSVVRLSSAGHFPYSAAPLITLMENVEKCYDGC